MTDPDDHQMCERFYKWWETCPNHELDSLKPDLREWLLTHHSEEFTALKNIEQLTSLLTKGLAHLLDWQEATTQERKALADKLERDHNAGKISWEHFDEMMEAVIADEEQALTRNQQFRKLLQDCKAPPPDGA
jgi:hypothetical protein